MTRAVPAWLLLVALLAVPFAGRLEIERPGARGVEVHFPFVDLAIWAILFLQVGYWARGLWRSPADRRRQARLELRRGIPRELTILVAVIATAFVFSGRGLSGATDLVQIVDYFIVWYWLVFRGIGRPGALAVLAPGGLGLLAIFVAFATWQAATATPPYLVRSLFRDHQTYLAGFVMIAPLAWSGATQLPAPVRRFAAPAVLGLGCATLGSIGTAVFVWLEITAMALLMPGRPWRGAAATIVATLALALLLPTSYRLAVTAEVAHGVRLPIGKRREDVLHAKGALQPLPPAFHLAIGRTHLFLGSETDPLRRFYPREYEQTVLRSPRTIHDYYPETWAGLRLVTSGPLLGRGLGTWLDWIGTAYGTLERTGTAFPNNVNGYLLIGVTTGIAGLAAWCFALARILRRTRRRWRRARAGPTAEVLAACLVGMGGGAVMLLFVPWAFQPLAVWWVTLAAIAHGAPISEVSS